MSTDTTNNKRENKIQILAVVGPTASGKSALALELAKRWDGEIVSCDSMQVYRGMDIGTAKPTKEEQAQVKHHMIDIIDPHQDFSCEDYVKGATEAVADCAKRGKLPIICGGTGLYLDGLLRGGNSAPACDDPNIRQGLMQRYQAEGIDRIYEELRAVDPQSADAIHPNNAKRVIRALEIYLACGIAKSELDRRSKLLEPRYDATVIQLCFEERGRLYERIEKRVDAMIEQGLERETRELLERGVFKSNRTAAAAIGYKEILPYIRGEVSLAYALEELKKATRRYAKRQVTWFSAKQYVTPLYADEKTFEEIVNNAEKLFKNPQ